MNREAKELLRIARDLVAMEFPSETALHKYLKDHPGAEKSNHKVVDKYSKTEYNEKGQKHGPSFVYDDKGHPTKMTVHHHGKKVSELKRNTDGSQENTHYHPNGKIRKRVDYYSKGKKQHDLNFDEDGKPHGKQEGWHPNGKKSYTENYENGLAHGRQQGWDENGNKQYDLEHEHGNLIRR